MERAEAVQTKLIWFRPKIRKVVSFLAACRVHIRAPLELSLQYESIDEIASCMDVSTEDCEVEAMKLEDEE